MNDAGLRIRNRRIEMNLTQEELALKVGYKSKVSISRLETCRDIPIKKLKPIADALQITVNELMDWNNQKYEEKNADTLMDALDDPLTLSLLERINKLNQKKKEALSTYIDFLLSQSESS